MGERRKGSRREWIEGGEGEEGGVIEEEEGMVIVRGGGEDSRGREDSQCE